MLVLLFVLLTVLVYVILQRIELGNGSKQNIKGSGGIEISCGYEADDEIHGYQGLDWGTRYIKRTGITAWVFLENCMTRQQFRAELGQSVVLGRLVVGHPHLNDLGVSDSIEVSRQHCTLFEKNNHVYIRNQSKTRQTFLNGIAVEGAQRITVGDFIQLGDVQLRVMEIKIRSTQKMR